MSAKSPSQADIVAISNRLSDVLHSCPSIHHLAQTDSDDAEWILVAIMEMARANVKGIDACLEKLSNIPAAGNFRDELELEEAETE